MTQQIEREIITVVVGLALFARAALPKPILQRANTPFENQIMARLVYVAMGLFGLGVSYSIYLEGKPVR
jgi:hypothetical protein